MRCSSSAVPRAETVSCSSRTVHQLASPPSRSCTCTNRSPRGAPDGETPSDTLPSLCLILPGFIFDHARCPSAHAFDQVSASSLPPKSRATHQSRPSRCAICASAARSLRWSTPRTPPGPRARGSSSYAGRSRPTSSKSEVPMPSSMSDALRGEAPCTGAPAFRLLLLGGGGAGSARTVFGGAGSVRATGFGAAAATETSVVRAIASFEAHLRCLQEPRYGVRRRVQGAADIGRASTTRGHAVVRRAPFQRGELTFSTNTRGGAVMRIPPALALALGRRRADFHVLATRLIAIGVQSPQAREGRGTNRRTFSPHASIPSASAATRSLSSTDWRGQSTEAQSGAWVCTVLHSRTAVQWYLSERYGTLVCWARGVGPKLNIILSQPGACNM